MNNRHIQTFLTVSAAFFAMNTPLLANARSQSGAGETNRPAQCARADVRLTAASTALIAGRKA
ncbi:MAG: hypothetical protein EPN70_12700 [Paraburkholderia sp.]|uniref:hypothetical protein n=1 Tax=Paraburkholderia sp. TaxID=1926495 RepID=UPI00121207BB|nr:hypothetical protein [Paraburkholderia sp.]TAM03940.1 MAG: hypothetical protein EPN70_12700 [Paraburkholderia sp.]TAM30714.1 MAG: hypothetical protein EPN59_08075 [Paraburkholderia sp.]